MEEIINIQVARRSDGIYCARSDKAGPFEGEGHTVSGAVRAFLDTLVDSHIAHRAVEASDG